MRLIEAVPNFSTSDPVVVQAIKSAIDNVSQSVVLHTDADHDYNRTVVTFVSTPEFIIEASMAAIETALDLIDMRQHQGEHPRIGAVDVFPLIPIKNVEDAECIAFARKIAEVTGSELDVPVYCYGKAALLSERVILSDIRRGEYEALEDKLARAEWQPDYGPAIFVPKSGAVVIGVRNFLIAYNINLNTDDVEIAHQISRAVRTSGYINSDGKRIPGSLDGIQAMGVTMKREDRGKFTQVSTNILDYQSKDSLHDVYEAVKMEAAKSGVTVTGSEIVGLIPQEALILSLQFYDPDIDSTNYGEYLHYLGLHDLYEFKLSDKVLESRISSHFLAKDH